MRYAGCISIRGREGNEKSDTSKKYEGCQVFIATTSSSVDSSYFIRDQDSNNINKVIYAYTSAILLETGKYIWKRL